MAVLDVQGSAGSFAIVKAIWRGIFGSTGALIMDMCLSGSPEPRYGPFSALFPAQHLVACAYHPPSEPPNIAEH